MNVQLFEFPGIKCPKCGNTKFKQDRHHLSRYYCPTPKGESFCGYGVYKCETCNKVYTIDHYGFRNDAYECKHCGRVQWEYTEEQRLKSKLKSDMSSLKNILSRF